MSVVYFVQAEEMTDAVAFRQGGKPLVSVAIGGPYSDGPIKIGFTNRVAERLNSIAWSVQQRVALVGAVAGDLSTEREVHRMFAHLRLGGDWRITSEWFSPAWELLNFITSLPRIADENVVPSATNPRRLVLVHSRATRAAVEVAKWLSNSDVSQAELAARVTKRLPLRSRAVNQSTISAIARGQRRPRPDIAIALHQEIGFPFDWWHSKTGTDGS